MQLSLDPKKNPFLRFDDSQETTLTSHLFLLAHFLAGLFSLPLFLSISPPSCNLHRETFVIISPALTVGTQHLRSQGLAIMKPSSLIWVTWPNFIMGFNHQHFITRAPNQGEKKSFSLVFVPFVFALRNRLLSARASPNGAV